WSDEPGILEVAKHACRPACLGGRGADGQGLVQHAGNLTRVVSMLSAAPPNGGTQAPFEASQPAWDARVPALRQVWDATPPMGRPEDAGRLRQGSEVPSRP